MEEDDQDFYEIRLARLREKHGGIADFKLICWARMLVSSENIITSTRKFHGVNRHPVRMVNC